MSAAAPDSESFYDRHWEQVDAAEDPGIVAKADLVLRMMPEGVRTVADVGCGDGYLTRRLAERYQVTALDRSGVAIERLRARGIEGKTASADALPLDDGAVDLAFSSEVLEHLPAGVFERAARELDRVARRYLLVSVPYREELRRRFLRCPRCALEFHLDGHLRSLDERALDAIFPRFTRVVTELAGPLQTPAYAPLEWLRQHGTRHWPIWDGMRTSCPRCGEDRFRKLGRTSLHSAAERALDRAASAWSRWRGRRAEPYWLLALYARRDA